MRDWLNDNVAQPNAAIALHALGPNRHLPTSLLVDLRPACLRASLARHLGTGPRHRVAPTRRHPPHQRPDFRPTPRVTVPHRGRRNSRRAIFRLKIGSCPFADEDEAAIDLILATGQTLHIDADAITIMFSGEAEFVGSIRGRMKSNPAGSPTPRKIPAIGRGENMMASHLKRIV